MKVIIFLAIFLALISITSCNDKGAEKKQSSNLGGSTEMNKMKSVTVGIPVTDMDKATKWYRSLLGKVEEMNPAPGVWEFSLTSTTWLQLFEVENSQPNTSVVRFETNNIKASHDLALKISDKVTEIKSVPEVIRYFDFQDPFGNALSFYELLVEQ